MLKIAKPVSLYKKRYHKGMNHVEFVIQVDKPTKETMKAMKTK